MFINYHGAQNKRLLNQSVGIIKLLSKRLFEIKHNGSLSINQCSIDKSVFNIGSLYALRSEIFNLHSIGISEIHSCNIKGDILMLTGSISIANSIIESQSLFISSQAELTNVDVKEDIILKSNKIYKSEELCLKECLIPKKVIFESGKGILKAVDTNIGPSQIEGGELIT